MSREKSSSPAGTIVALSKSDTVDFAARPRGIIIGTGTIVFVNEDETTTTVLTGVLDVGVVHNMSPKRINATGTTATVLYGIY